MEAIQKPFNDYIKELKKTHSPDATEHTLRTSLETLLKQIAKQIAKQQDTKIEIEQEARQTKQGFGRPDFTIKRGASIIGYIETKPIGTKLNELYKSKQIKKYCELTDNLILTDYIKWILFYKGKVIDESQICTPSNLEDQRFTKPDPAYCKKTFALLDWFFSQSPEGVGNARDLAKALAIPTRRLRDFLNEQLEQKQERGNGEKLLGLYKTLQKILYENLSIKEFSDTFAQMLSYSLFLAKREADTEKLSLLNIYQYIPTNFEVIKEMVDFLRELDKPDYKKIQKIVEDILYVINEMDLGEVEKDLDFANPSPRLFRAMDEEDRLSQKDPYIYFYEDFLAQYDANLRKTKGVYYTPKPVVSFIVRSLDYILKKHFNLEEGLGARHKVTALDFATGTGTFLLELMKQVLDNVPKGEQEGLIKEHILKNFYGFELLMAPYTIAHLKLSQYLKQMHDYTLQDKERIAIYLTNTLEYRKIIQYDMKDVFPEISKEGEIAQEIKEKKILVITGNPPYSGISKNKSKFITKLIEDYKKVGDTPLNERKHWLNDDYVKFIRYAQWMIQNNKEGVVGIITNHSFIDNPTFRGMRYSLMKDFDAIYILDLHGNSLKKEKTPTGEKDENVFDIQQGVAISFFIKNKHTEKGIFHADLYGTRKDKYETLIETDISSTKWQKLTPNKPSYLFIPQNGTASEQYEKGWQVTKIFQENVSGIVSMGDNFIFAHNKEELVEKIEGFLSKDMSESSLKDKYQLGKNYAKWILENKKSIAIDDKKYKSISYRPFDTRWTYYDNKLLWRWRDKVMHHMLAGDNLGLLVSRSAVGMDVWREVFITNNICEFGIMSTRPGNSTPLFPLYVYKKEGELSVEKREENFTEKFRAFINKKYGGAKFKPEDILGYIYAVLYAPLYREKYLAFLKMDFPRIPFVDNVKTFRILSKLGNELKDAHLFREIPPKKLALYEVAGDNKVEKPRYSELTQQLYINDKQYFSKVPKEVWEFHIGGYQVLDKYLKSRKGRTLSFDEITNIKNIVKTLDFTIKQMGKINSHCAFIG